MGRLGSDRGDAVGGEWYHLLLGPRIVLLLRVQRGETLEPGELLLMPVCDWLVVWFSFNVVSRRESELLQQR